MSDCAQSMSHHPKHAPASAPMKAVTPCVLGCMIADQRAPEIHSVPVSWTAVTLTAAVDHATHTADLGTADPPPRLRTV